MFSLLAMAPAPRPSSAWRPRALSRPLHLLGVPLLRGGGPGMARYGSRHTSVRPTKVGKHNFLASSLSCTHRHQLRLRVERSLPNYRLRLRLQLQLQRLVPSGIATRPRCTCIGAQDHAPPAVAHGAQIHTPYLRLTSDDTEAATCPPAVVHTA